jgi:hypothetical protein
LGHVMLQEVLKEMRKEVLKGPPVKLNALWSGSLAGFLCLE